MGMLRAASGFHDTMPSSFGALGWGMFLELISKTACAWTVSYWQRQTINMYGMDVVLVFFFEIISPFLSF